VSRSRSDTHHSDPRTTHHIRRPGRSESGDNGSLARRGAWTFVSAESGSWPRSVRFNEAYFHHGYPGVVEALDQRAVPEWTLGSDLVVPPRVRSRGRNRLGDHPFRDRYRARHRFGDVDRRWIPGHGGVALVGTTTGERGAARELSISNRPLDPTGSLPLASAIRC
jgi:hypothetical protein